MILKVGVEVPSHGASHSLEISRPNLWSQIGSRLVHVDVLLWQKWLPQLINRPLERSLPLIVDDRLLSGVDATLGRQVDVGRVNVEDQRGLLSGGVPFRRLEHVQLVHISA